MVKHGFETIADFSTETWLTLEAICEGCQTSPDFIHHLIEYEIIHPKATAQEVWVFELREVKRIRTALRLQRDLEINLSGIAVVLDLLDELDDLRVKAQLFEKHLLK